jgi:hypothetical protein
MGWSDRAGEWPQIEAKTAAGTAFHVHHVVLSSFDPRKKSAIMF